LGVVDAIVDITETGSSLVANRLELREEILQSEMVLIGTKDYKSKILDLLIKRIHRVNRAKSHVLLKFNIQKSLLKKACSLHHGMSSPTINNLEDSDSVAIEVAISKSELHNLMDKLIDIGATGILAQELSLCAPDA
jgi:ATP phosphoribosyltransferase